MTFSKYVTTFKKINSYLTAIILASITKTKQLIPFKEISYFPMYRTNNDFGRRNLDFFSEPHQYKRNAMLF
jgi:hypothetical protein